MIIVCKENIVCWKYLLVDGHVQDAKKTKILMTSRWSQKSRSSGYVYNWLVSLSVSRL